MKWRGRGWGGVGVGVGVGGDRMFRDGGFCLTGGVGVGDDG